MAFCDAASLSSNETGEAADCTLETETGYGPGGTPLTPRDVFDVGTIAALTLEDLGWVQECSTVQDGVEVIVGSWSGGSYKGYDSAGSEACIELHERAALYLPSGWLATPGATKGLVYGVHFEVNVFSSVAASVARNFGIPVLYHGQKSRDWRDLGYASRGDWHGASGRLVTENNPCQPVDLIRGNVPYYLARTHLRAITLLERYLESRGGVLDSVALRGFSKEGRAVWLACLVDPRVEVASAGGYHGEDFLEMLRRKATDWGCDTATPRGAEGRFSAERLGWFQTTRAGAALLAIDDVATNRHLLYPRLFLLDGDTAGPDLHDAIWPLGAETPWLESFVERPWRYVRKAVKVQGADLDEGDETSTAVVPMLLAELLVAPAGTEDGFYPKVLDARANLAADLLRVSATCSAPTGAARVWWSASADRVWNEPGQATWMSVEMAYAEGAWTAPAIQVPPSAVIGWYVEAENTTVVGTTSLVRRDASPVRFLRETAPDGCAAQIDWCR